MSENNEILENKKDNSSESDTYESTNVPETTNSPDEPVSTDISDEIEPEASVEEKDEISNDDIEDATDEVENDDIDSKSDIPKTKKATFKPWMGVTLGIILILFAGFLCLPLTIEKDAIASNVWSGNVNLSGLSVAEAEALLENSYKTDKIDFSVCFSHEGKTEKTSFTSDDIDFSVNPKETAMLAYNTGRSKNIFKNSWDVLCSYFTKVDVGRAPQYNDEKISKILYDLGATIHGQGKDVEYIIDQNILTIIPATPGQSYDLSIAKEEFFNSVKSGKYTDIPVTLNNNSNDKLDVDKVYERLAKDPIDASYKIEGSDVVITDHQVGIQIDKAKLSALVDNVNNNTQGSIEINIILPQKTRESLERSLFGTVLGTFTSDYSSSSSNRAFNVELAANKINGTILVDGEEFSYNNVVGNANAANGFKLATIFSGGKVTEGVGGGVCQISSTLYCAALRSDLEIIERHNHSLPISYVPGGQDATVSYGILDFRFKNNTGAPIKIVATHANRKVTVSIIGSDSAKKRVEVSSAKISSVAPSVVETPDPTLPLGERKVTERGKYGSVYMMYKRVYANDGSLQSESSVKSIYKATPEQVLVGTGEAITTENPVENPEDPNNTSTPPTDDDTDSENSSGEGDSGDAGDLPEDTGSSSDETPEQTDIPIDLE